MDAWREAWQGRLESGEPFIQQKTTQLNPESTETKTIIMPVRTDKSILKFQENNINKDGTEGLKQFAQGELTQSVDTSGQNRTI